MDKGTSRRDFLGKSLMTGATLALGSRIAWPDLASAQGLEPKYARRKP